MFSYIFMMAILGMSNPTNDANPFQNPRGNNLPYLINHMFNENFNNNQTVNNSNYCYVTTINGTCESSYSWTQAKQIMMESYG